MGSLRGRVTKLLVICCLLLGASSARAQTETDSRAMSDRTKRFLADLAAGHHDGVSRTLSPSLLAQAPLATLQKLWSDQKKQGVQFDKLKTLQVTWYPPSAEVGPVTLVAVDVSTPAQTDAFVCGFLLWEMVKPEPRITRVELGHISRSARLQIGPATFRNVTRQYQCRHVILPVDMQ